MTATVVEPGTVRFERVLPGPVERVWAYITEEEKRARWLCGGALEPRKGARLEMKFDHSRLSSETPPEKYKGVHEFTGTVTRCEPMRLFAHTWTWETGDTEVTYELTPRGRETLLVITHRRLPDRDGTLSVMSGWDAHTGILADLLAGVEPRPFWTTFAKLEAQYAAALPSGA